MGVCVGGRAVVESLRNGLDNLATGNVEVDGVGEDAHDVASALRTLNVSGQQNDGGLVRGNLCERDGHLGGGALDLRGSTEGALRGVIVLTEAFGARRIGHQVGVVLRVLINDVTVEAPVGARGDLVDDRRAGHGLVACGEHNAPHDGLVLVAIFVLAEGQPAVLLVARNAGGAAQHVELALNLLAELDRVLLTAGTGVVGQAVGGDMAVPLRGGLNLLIEDDGHHTVSTPGATADDDAVVGDDLELTSNVRTEDALPRRGVDDRGVVGEVVAGLHAAVGLPRQLDAEVPPVTHSLGLTASVVDELSIVPIQGDLVAHIRGRLRAAQGGRRRRGLSADKLRQAEETQNQCESRKKNAKVTALQGNHRKLLSTGCATASPHTAPVYANHLQYGQESERLVPQAPQLTRATKANPANLSD